MERKTLGARTRRWAALTMAALALGCANNDEPSDLLVPARIDQSVGEGGPNPANVLVQVTNRGNCQLGLVTSSTTASGGAWLSVSPTNLNVAAGSTSPLTLTFNVITTNLLPGNYVGTVTLVGTCTATTQAARGSPKAISVNLRVTPIGAAIAVDQTNVGVDTTAVLDDWKPMADNTLYAGREHHTAIWTGREMWVFGGVNVSGQTQGVGGKYDPLVDTWSSMPVTGGPPQARYLHTAVWTGTEMIIWGGQPTGGGTGQLSTGARLGSVWTQVSGTNAPSARSQHTAIWTGTEMLVWGGGGPGGFAPNPLGDGARYNPIVGNWQALTLSNAPSARYAHSAVWTGKEMLVWGGYEASGNPGVHGGLATGGRFNPVTNLWSAMPAGGPARGDLISAWTGSQWLLYGGEDAGTFPADGMTFSPTDGTWTEIPAYSPTRTSYRDAYVWSGSELMIWGNVDGERYNPATRTWSPIINAGDPSQRTNMPGVWTGTHMIVWGGDGLTDGALYH